MSKELSRTGVPFNQRGIDKRFNQTIIQQNQAHDLRENELVNQIKEEALEADGVAHVVGKMMDNVEKLNQKRVDQAGSDPILNAEMAQFQVAARRIYLRKLENRDSRFA